MKGRGEGVRDEDRNDLREERGGRDDRTGYRRTQKHPTLRRPTVAEIQNCSKQEFSTVKC